MTERFSVFTVKQLFKQIGFKRKGCDHVMYKVVELLVYACSLTILTKKKKMNTK